MTKMDWVTIQIIPHDQMYGFWHIVLNFFQHSAKVGISVFNYGCELKKHFNIISSLYEDNGW
jgi:hypothetical protein